jgi:hypothetical protein
MGRYSHDPTQVIASFVTLPKDDYEFEVGKPRAFERTAAKGHQSYGVRFPLKVVSDGPENGKKTMYTCYLHSEGGQQMAKRFQMAAAGFSAINEKSEKAFDGDPTIQGADWSYDPETGEVGSGWAAYEGLHLFCDVDQEQAKNPDGSPRTDDKTGEPIMQQTWGTWRPLEGAAVTA